ncbi:cache domain-containing protein [Leucobacter coleopterorum]|uniref:cache domain-containing protein n=1 Tax=Leucobacter coleopterorum TaxID=2714933 RepID=UPI001FCA790B|nr:cache domain-containing protein [Leucobacter coleopterorum]
MLEQLDTWFAERFTRLDSVRDELLNFLRRDSAGALDLSESVRRKLKAVATRFLAENASIDGCGLVLAHSALGTENGHLEWWVREDESRFARYSFGVVPGADRYYDYDHHQWFIRAFQQGAPALVGPYIDYLGVESYVMTLAVPGEVEGQRVGVIANDIQVEDLERALLPVLLECTTPVALMSHHGTVICSNSSQFLPGDWVSPSLNGFGRLPLHVPSDELQLLYAI